MFRSVKDSPHYRDGAFRNLYGRDVLMKGPGDIARWMIFERWNNRGRIPARRHPVPTVENDGAELRRGGRPSLTWIGHASYLIQAGGLNVIIDPNFHAPPFMVRNVAPGVSVDGLPPIDLVLITHNHLDHLDLRSVRMVRPRLGYRVPLGLGPWFHKRGLRPVYEYDWWESEQVEGVELAFVPSQHWSKRSVGDTNQTLWGGWVVTGGSLRFYHSGDTAWFDGFGEIGRRYPGIDFAMLPIGAYEPRWFMRDQHMNPEEAGRAFVELGAATFAAMHWATFRLTDEPWLEPPARIRAFFAENGLSMDRLWIPAIGESRFLTECKDAG